MKSGIQHFPYTVSQGNNPRLIVSPIKVTSNKVKPMGTRLSLDSLALWDTGADYCAISSELAASLRLIPQGEASVNRVENAAVVSRCYLVTLILPNGIFFEDVPVIEDAGLKAMGVDFVVGLAVINDLDFALTHDNNGHTILSIS